MRSLLELAEKKRTLSSFVEGCCEILRKHCRGVRVSVRVKNEEFECSKGNTKGKKFSSSASFKGFRVNVSLYGCNRKMAKEDVAFYLLWGLRSIVEKQEARERETEFFTLYETGKMLTSSLDILVIQQKTVEAITNLVECEAGSLLLLDEERGELYFQVALGEKGEKVKEIRLKVGEGIAGWVAKEGKSVIVNNVERDPRWFRGADERSRFKTRSMLCVPVKSRGRVIGVLQAINKKNEKFKKRDLELLELMSNQLSVAIENARLFEEIKMLFFETSQALAEAIEMRDPYTGGHTKRVMDYSIQIGKEMGLSVEELEKLRIAAILHDIGKIGIEDRILRKKGSLSIDEIKKMQLHTVIGEEIVKKVRSLTDVAKIIRSHQERYDGKGYPDGLRGKDIPLGARIIAVADTFDALTTDRPYRKALSVNDALEEILRGKGSQFDEEVVSAFVSAYKKGKISAGRKGS